MESQGWKSFACWGTKASAYGTRVAGLENDGGEKNDEEVGNDGGGEADAVRNI
jgi:hypothetical protein